MEFAAAEEGRPVPVEFTGRASEYFGIWLANVALSIVTLGIYSAWAKVRRRRYFLGNTVILGDRLDYHATGMMILKGRFVAALAIAAYVALSYAEPWAQVIMVVALLPVYPWIINRALKFNARMTSWRNVRFDWHGGYWGIVKIYLLWPVAAVLTLGILAPVAARRVREYLANHYAFGRERFAAVTALRPYYCAFLKAGVIGVGAAVLALLLTMIAGQQLVALRQTGADLAPFPAAAVIGALLGGLIWFLPVTYFWIAARNILVNALTLGEAARFHSAVLPLRYLWILITNFLAVVFTAMLMYPWARVRQYRYQAECTAVTPLMPAVTFLDIQTRAGSAAGEELGAVADVEIGL